MLVSVCVCAINARWEVKTFVESLHRHNSDTHFEVVITLDDRVEDGSREEFAKLQQRFSNVKVVMHYAHESTEYLSRLLDYYDENKLFPEELRRMFRERFDQYKAGTLYDPADKFLWLSSGPLYNKAIKASKGDLIIVTPGDFLYLFRLKDVVHFVEQHQKDGVYYGKPNAVWARLTNYDVDWLKQHVQEVHDGKQHRPGYRWDSEEVAIDYLRYPPKLSDFYVPDFRNNKLYPVDEPDFCLKMHEFCRQHIDENIIQHIRGFHGFHFMTRAAYEKIGGFTEEYFGRAWADDKMTYHGTHYINGRGNRLPPHLSVLWTGQGEVIPERGPGYSFDIEARLKEIDEYYGKHPLPHRWNNVYLYDTSLYSHIQMSQLALRHLSISGKPVLFN